VIAEAAAEALLPAARAKEIAISVDAERADEP